MTRPPADLLRIAPDIADALAAHAPVVALESTLITHGMAPPDNLKTARAAEAAIRDGGALPATIAVLDGRLAIGLTPAELERLADTRDAAKLSRADLAHGLRAGGVGGTTVAATMIAARLAGIEVFATGGIGGVHRGAATSFDVSADLQELARTPVTVVASGAKAILDLPATLEMLETLGVPVITFGQDDFPSFWSRNSGLASPLRADDPAAIAETHRLRARLGLSAGQLVANPVPAGMEIPRETISPIIETALDAAAETGVTGKAVTPFVLGQIAEASGGAALRANSALIASNAALAARIAVALAAQPRS